jgi:ATP-dependent helicase/DNAse subunit B
MINKTIFIILFLLMSTILTASSDMASLAKNLNLYAGTKASIQWERIFSSERRLKRYKLDKLDEIKLIQLKNYLIKHSADSKQPVVPGL